MGHVHETLCMSRSKKATVPGHLKAELATLDTGQLEAVAKLAASLLGGTFTPKEKVLRAETGGQHARAEALYDALAVELMRKRSTESKPFQLLLSRQDQVAKNMLEKHAELDRFLDRACGSYKLTEGERLKFYTFTANIIANALVNAEMTMTIATLVSWLSHAPSEIDKQFPGYVRAGVLHTIIGAVLQIPVTGSKGALVEVRNKKDDNKPGRRSRSARGVRLCPAPAKKTPEDLKNRYRSKRTRAS